MLQCMLYVFLITHSTSHSSRICSVSYILYSSTQIFISKILLFLISSCILTLDYFVVAMYVACLFNYPFNLTFQLYLFCISYFVLRVPKYLWFLLMGLYSLKQVYVLLVLELSVICTIRKKNLCNCVTFLAVVQ